MKRIKNWLCRALGCEKKPKPPKRKVVFSYRIGLAQTKTKGSKMPLELTITTTQEVKVNLAPVTDETPPKPAELDNPPTWERISGEANVVPSEDGMSARLVSADAPGDSQFIVKGDADLGEGEEEISDVITLHVIGARAKFLGLTAEAPVPKQPL